MQRIARSHAIAVLVAACSACVGPPPMTTPLNVPIASDHDRFTVTLTTMDGTLHRGSNTFAVRVVASDGTPAQLVQVTAVMPAHGHGTDVPLIEAAPDGTFRVLYLDFTMPGEWLLTLSLSRTGATADDRATVWAEIE
jgi:hypothetical protein